MNEKLSNETGECIILNLRLLSISLNSHNARKSVSLHSQSRFVANLCPEVLHQAFISGSAQGWELLIWKTSPTVNFFIDCHEQTKGTTIQKSPFEL